MSQAARTTYMMSSSSKHAAWPDSPPGLVRGRPLLWLLRLLLNLGVFKALVERKQWPETNICEGLGVSYEMADDIPPAKTRRALEQWLAQAEASVGEHDALGTNIDWLADRLGLDRTERELLALVVLQAEDEALQQSFNVLRRRMNDRLHAILGRVLDVPAARVLDALRPDGVLLGTGLVKRVKHSWHTPTMLSCPEGLDAMLLVDHVSADELMEQFFSPAPSTALSLDDYPHVEREVGIARRLLRAAVTSREQGVNVLMYGAPGTGKTELARALAASAGAQLVAVAPGGKGSAPGSEPNFRFGAYALTQRFVACARNTVILFDEAEDVFPSSLMWAFGPGRDDTGRKAWINRILEENPVPAIWVTNGLDFMDEAFLRRFDMAIELRSPPVDVRRRILESETRELAVGPAWIERAARNEQLQPANIARAVRVARLVGASEREDVEDVLSRTIEGKLIAEGRGNPPRTAPNDACAYDPTLVNASLDLESLATGLAERRRGNICFYGLPGTGKSAFAAHLAERLSMSLIVRRASDVLHPYVGMTERLLARMFREAKAARALLFLDEVDSFLQDRRSAVRSWEITQVNELLVQMESFEGVFVCATNLVETLDRAAFRRFALKVRFDPLRPEQRERMLRATLATFGIDAASKLPGRLARLDQLVPGDFAAVARRLRILGGPIDAERLVAELGEEIAARGESGGSVGFRM